MTAELGTQAMLVDLADSTANDLSATRAWRPVEQELRRGKVKALTIDLPCNTWSRARRAPPWSRMPKPLRGDGPGELWGLKGLPEKDQAKVAAANRMTRAAFRAIKVADSLSIPGFLENPRKSRLWQTRGIKNLLKSASTQIVIFLCASTARNGAKTRGSWSLGCQKAVSCWTCAKAGEVSAHARTGHTST